MDINVVHRYSHLGEKLLHITQNTLSIKLTGTLQVCERCARSKEKAHAPIRKTYTRASNIGDTTGTFMDSLIGNQYWIGVVDDCSRYS